MFISFLKHFCWNVAIVCRWLWRKLKEVIFQTLIRRSKWFSYAIIYHLISFFRPEIEDIVFFLKVFFFFAWCFLWRFWKVLFLCLYCNQSCRCKGYKVWNPAPTLSWYFDTHIECTNGWYLCSSYEDGYKMIFVHHFVTSLWWGICKRFNKFGQNQNAPMILLLQIPLAKRGGTY